MQVQISKETDYELLQQVQANQKLREEVKEMKRKIVLLEIESQSVNDRYKDSLCFLEVERAKNKGVYVKRVEGKGVREE